MNRKTPQLFVVMGVSGCGKTTVGEALAAHLNCSFYDGDDFHPPENVAKMARGIPLNDMDRAPWLARLVDLLQEHLDRGESIVLACSALKKRYRDQLRVSEQVQFIYLEGDFEVIWQRMQSRKNHYMKPEMLRSQFEALEPPNKDEAIKVPIGHSVDEIMDLILQTIL
ncbi:MAG: gluconokinase [Anaerolineales bacterium]|nr:gluconokinase [Anaerolineales bacterium]